VRTGIADAQTEIAHSAEVVCCSWTRSRSWADDAGAIVVAGSRRPSSGEVALAAVAAFFNDAGVGKDGAGIAALDLQQRGVPAGGAYSARIGDAWTPGQGVISQLNDAARAGGCGGESLQAALQALSLVRRGTAP
jgi:hypothetical protein